MSDFVLVHGGWQGAWCWYKVVPLLERLGHRVITPDLPGHGRDRTPPEGLTLRRYADRVLDALGESAAPAVLVGHSLGGMVISQAAADRPDLVARLVYVAAFLPTGGQSLADLAWGDAGSILEPNCIVEPPGTAIRLREDALREVFFADCTAGLFDGFRLDGDGRIWTSAGDGVHCYDPDGTLIGKIKVPEVVANCTFGGVKRNVLYICGTTSLYAVRLMVNGAKTV